MAARKVPTKTEKGKGKMPEELEYLQFGTQQLPVLPEEEGFKPLRGCPIQREEKVLLDALYRAQTSTAKLNACNALNYYFSKMKENPPFQKPEKKFYVLFRGHKPGIYSNYGSLMRATKDFEKPFFKGFSTFDEAEQAAKQFFATADLEDPIFFMETIRNPTPEEEEVFDRSKLIQRWRYEKNGHRKMRGLVTELQQEVRTLRRNCSMIFQDNLELQQMLNFTDNYSRMSQILRLSVRRRRNFLNSLPDPIVQKILQMSTDSLFGELLGIQEFLWNLRVRKADMIVAYVGDFRISFVQFSENFEDEVTDSPMLVEIRDPVKFKPELIQELFFAGFLHMLRYPSAPTFFGKKACTLINMYIDELWPEYSPRMYFTFWIFSTHPRMEKDEFIPAKHHILLTTMWDTVTFMSVQQKPIFHEKSFHSTKTYDGFPMLWEHIQLLGETSTMKIWVPKDSVHPTLKPKIAPASSSPYCTNSDEDIMEQLDQLLMEE